MRILTLLGLAIIAFVAGCYCSPKVMPMINETWGKLTDPLRRRESTGIENEEVATN